MSSIRHKKSERVRTPGKINSETWETKKTVSDIAAVLMLEPDFPDKISWRNSENWIETGYSDSTTVFSPKEEDYQISVTEMSYGRHSVDFIYFEHPTEKMNKKILDYREKL